MEYLEGGGGEVPKGGRCWMRYVGGGKDMCVCEGGGVFGREMGQCRYHGPPDQGLHCSALHSTPLPSLLLPSPLLPSLPSPRGEICTLPVGDDSLTYNRDEF